MSLLALLFLFTFGIIFNTLDDLVPQEHLVRKLDNCIDFRFIEELVKDLYSGFGRLSIPPVVLFKLIFINIIFGINSMRRTCEECKVNIAYRWFLGLSMYDDIPNYSTWSQNYIRRYRDSDVFDKIFEKILDQAIEYGFVDPETVFGDGTHQKANANKNKHKDVEVEIVKKVYEDKSLEETDENRYTQNWKDNYPQRKKTIERFFGDCKEQHNLRFTRIRGLLTNEQNTTMIFAYHNLKKMANWRWKTSPNKSLIKQIIGKLVKFQKKRSTFHFEYTSLSTI